MDPVTVYVFPNQFEGELARTLLEANGILAYFAGGTPVIAGGAVIPACAVLQVAREDLERAAKLLRKVKKHRTKDHAEWNMERPSLSILIYNWIRFGLGLVGLVAFLFIAILCLVENPKDTEDWVGKIIGFLLSAFLAAICFAILKRETENYFAARKSTNEA